MFAHYARHYETGEPMPADLAAKIVKAKTFNQGYEFTEILAASELDMQWHMFPASAPLQDPDVFEQEALKRTHLSVSYVPPRYRSSNFLLPPLTLRIALSTLSGRSMPRRPEKRSFAKNP